MKKVILVGCVKNKRKLESSRAIDLYKGDLYNKRIAYAKSLTPDNIYILSAKYELLELDEIIGYYDKSLNKATVSERKNWAKRVLEKLEKLTDIKNDFYIFLAGKEYIEFISPQLSNWENPLEGKKIGEQLQWLKKHL